MTGAAAAVWLVAGACGPQTEPAVKAGTDKRAEAAPKEEKSSAAEVTVDEARQKEGGVVTETVSERQLAESIRVTGRIVLNENQTWRVGAIIEGRVVQVFVNAGDRVKKGQVLARLHSHEVHEARAAHANARTELARLREQERHATRVRDRARRLYELKAGSLEQAELAEAELRNVQAGIRQAETEVARTRTHLVEFLEIEPQDPGHHREGAHGDEDWVPIRASADGTVLERKVSIGSVLQPGQEAFVVSDLSSLWMIAAIGEEHFGRVRPGMPVQVTVQSHAGRAFPGRLERMGEQLDPSTRTLQGRILLPNPHGLLKPEMYGDAELQLPSRRAALFVAETALQEVKGQTVVFVRVAPTVFEARAVETGRSVNGMVEALSGVSRGDQVAVRGAFLLKSQLLRSSLAEEE